MIKTFLQDPEAASRTTDFVVDFILFGGQRGLATHRRITVRTCDAGRAIRLAKKAYRRSGEHRVLHAEPLLAVA